MRLGTVMSSCHGRAQGSVRHLHICTCEGGSHFGCCFTHVLWATFGVAVSLTFLPKHRTQSSSYLEILQGFLHASETLRWREKYPLLQNPCLFQWQQNMIMLSGPFCRGGRVPTAVLIASAFSAASAILLFPSLFHLSP